MFARHRIRITAAIAAAIATLGVMGSIGTALAVEPPENPVVSGLVPGMDPASPEALGWTSEQYETARAYSRSGWALAFIDPLVGMAALGLLAFTGFAGRLAGAIRRRLSSRTASDAVFVVALVTCLAVLNFPLELYRFQREHAYGFANQPFGPWMIDELKGLVIMWIIASVFLVPVWAVIRRWPRTWWMIGTAIGVAGSILLIMVAPVFIAPLFNTFTPLRDKALEKRILELAHRNGIPAEDVFEVDASRQSRHDNAYVVGLLGTERIVLYDTLLSAYTPEEIEFVMGHEMGHYKLEHLWKGIGLAAILIAAGFFIVHRLMGRAIGRFGPRLGYRSAGSIAAVPLLLLFFSAYLFLARPITSAVSRHFEHRADIFALETMRGRPGGRSIAVSAFQKMAARNLSDPDPPALIEWWLYSHPSIGRRIRFCAGQP